MTDDEHFAQMKAAGLDPDAEHTHKCGFTDYFAYQMLLLDGYDVTHLTSKGGCGAEWKHSERAAVKEIRETDSDKPHMCPNCGRGPWITKYKDENGKLFTECVPNARII